MFEPKKLIRVLIFVLAAIIIGLIAYRFMGGHDHHGHHHHQSQALIPTEGYGNVEPFSMTDQNNQTVTLDSLKGSPWIANFIFTRCSGPCPIITGKTVSLQKELSDVENLKFVSFSVDPDYDQPPVLKEYAARFKANEDNWIFLTAEKSKMYDLIRNNFHLAVDKGDGFVEPADENHILHSLHFVLVNEEGEIQGYFNSNDPEAVASLKARVRAG